MRQHTSVDTNEVADITTLHAALPARPAQRRRARLGRVRLGVGLGAARRLHLWADDAADARGAVSAWVLGCALGVVGYGVPTACFAAWGSTWYGWLLWLIVWTLVWSAGAACTLAA